MIDEITAEIQAAYDQNPAGEWERLEQNPFEMPIHLHYMQKYIKPGQRVLDVGGGPGRYSIWLAQQGCRVTMVDLSPANIEYAKQKAKELGVDGIEMIQGNVLQIEQMVKGPYDHVLLMGPLYHLLVESDRVEAIMGCLSLLKEDGIFFAAYISLWAGMIYNLREMPEIIMDPNEIPYLDCFLKDRSYSGKAFTYAHFTRIQDILLTMRRFPLHKLHLIGSESILAPFKSQLMNLPQNIRQQWLDYALAFCEREDCLNYSEHLMYIGRKTEC